MRVHTTTYKGRTYQIPDAWLMGQMGTMGRTLGEAVETWHVQSVLAEQEGEQ